MPPVEEIRRELRARANPEKARILQGFFKTGPGQYGEGDVFLGVAVPAQRAIVRRFPALELDAIAELLESPVHEERLTALLLLVRHFRKADAAGRRRICRFYLRHARRVNNWDLVDSSAPYIVGPYLDEAGDAGRVLEKLARSRNLWERRIAMVATYHFIRQGRPEIALRIAGLLLSDGHDLIHKAVGWMLREAGKRCGEPCLLAFLDRHAATMPRTALRYAIERLDEGRRRRYMALTPPARTSR